jgi:2-oxoglutarate ferredoxin oxidoreductase subunit delta
MSPVLTRGTVTMEVERCKGCELCIPACRPGVLAMSTEVNAQGFRYPLLAPGCTACKACFDVCPDFVFEVYRYDEAFEIDVADAGPGWETASGASEPAVPGEED